MIRTAFRKSERSRRPWSFQGRMLSCPWFGRRIEDRLNAYIDRLETEPQAECGVKR